MMREMEDTKKKNYASIIYRDKKYNIQREKDTEWEL